MINSRIFSLNVLILVPALCLCLCLSLPASAAESFTPTTRQSGYWQPLATVMGSVMNGGWSQSASVGRTWGFGFSLPMAFAYISEKDHTFISMQPSGCASSRAIQSTVDCPDPDYIGYKVPTLFGPLTNVKFQKHDLQENGEPSGNYTVMQAGSGDSKIRDFVNIPFLSPQAAFSMYYTEVKVRYLYLPFGALGMSGHVYGMGIQHDLASFIKQEILDISLGAALSGSSVDFDLNDYEGTVKLSGVSAFYGLITGKRWGLFEVFSEIGWETSSLAANGRIADANDPADVSEMDLHANGRNGLRLGLNFALHLGYQPVAGQAVGAQLGNTINLLSYRKEGNK